MASSIATSGLLFVAWLFTPTTVYGIQQLRGLSNINDGAQRTSSEEMLKNSLVNDITYLYTDNNYISQVSSSTNKESGTTYGIPKAFVLEDSLLLRNDEPKYQPFPRWHNRTNEYYELTMMEALFDFVNATSVSYHTSNSNINAKLTDHINDYYGETPEILYVLRNNGVYATQTGLDIYSKYGGEFTKKPNAIHSLMKRSYDILFLSNKTSILQLWPRLFQLVVHEKRDVPFLIWYLDYTGCNRHNWRNNQSVPVFTMAANVDCDYTFPIPTYETYLSSVETSEQVQSVSNTKTQLDISIWKSKKPSVLWRGSMTGQKRTTLGLRYELLKLIHSDEQLSKQQQQLFDVKPTHLGGFVEYNESFWPIVGYKGKGVDYIPGHLQDSYRAILDVDGHSWSARFGNLLGKPSVILKIEPQEVDYFHFKRSKDDASKRLLEPWKHYIPVKRDLSDLVEKVKYVLSDTNADHIVQIISNANEWHRANMVKDVVAHDMLDVWESYITLLDKYSPGWADQWEQSRQTIMTDASLNMSLIPEFV